MADPQNTSHPARSSGAAFATKIDQDKGHRSKGKSLRPLVKLWPFIKRYPGQLTAFLVFLILSSIGSLILPLILKLIVDCGFGDPADMTPMCRNFSITGETSLDSYFLTAAAFAILFAAFGALRFFFITRLGQRVIADIRKAVFNRLTLLSPAYFERVRTGEVLSRLTTDTTLVETVITGSVSFALRSIAQIIGAIILMFLLSWQLALMVLAIAPAMILPLALTGKKIKRFSRDSQDRLADASARAGEAIGSIQTVQAYTQEAHERDIFGRDIEASFTAQRKRIAIQSILTAIMMATAFIGIIGILNYGAKSVDSGRMTGGDITAFVALAFLAIAGASSLTETFTNLLRAAGASDRIVDILDQKPVITAPQSPKILTDVKGQITFDSVSFSYPSRPDLPALRGVNFQINPGQTVAIVGPSGAGKTTIFQSLLRFYDVTSGEITIDGVNIRKLDPYALREIIAVVQQDTPLFSGTAAENIGYGRISASQDEIETAAKAAFAHEFIMALPEQYKTDLGERGTTLSGGQKQRIAIARAILRDAPILLLDEATSALDSESERAVQQAFDAMSADRTTLVIAHRLSTVLRADKILVFDKGRIIETGTHAELMKKGGLYAKLAGIQFDQSAGLKA